MTGETPAAFFVAKVDVSEMSLEKILEKVPEFQRTILQNEMDIFQVDYTQDFSGTMDRKIFVEHLQKQGFCLQGETMENRRGTVLDNSSVGKHVLSILEEDDGVAVRRKIYNKIVSQIEAGEVQESFGGHLPVSCIPRICIFGKLFEIQVL